MAALGFTQRPFFDDKNAAFWNLQTVGWAGYLLLRLVSAFNNGVPATDYVPILTHVATGYSITLVMASAFRLLTNRRQLVTYGGAVLVIVVSATLFSLIDAWIYNVVQRPGQPFVFTRLFGTFAIDLLLIAAWSALYFAINFYLVVEEQADQLSHLEGQASSAQLAMLRYQLNPHFLFNTLNSISTLVLLKQTERANAMLSRLSSFLRYTLANEPTAHVTVEQEFETLKLYLEIEKMRFESRLRASFEVDPSVERARLPSLLLQPLVENAIKYAVTPQEDGADITVAARQAGDRLLLSVVDSGPGLNDRPALPSYSTGVGLANIRDRLSQAYGANHRFEAKTRSGGGFGVTIDIPFQTDQLARDST